mmetsp:Transcript_31705/g.76970  ORF Transcript_31705/g.76970 Transcript_31705/m.76970 type:complete len:335 (-) Transcript_31705:3417-4421(-)
MNQGNLRYRDIIHLYTNEYVNAKKRIEKERITKLVKKAVESNGGRFLRPLSMSSTSLAMGISGGEPKDATTPGEHDDNALFVVESNAKIMEKIKRALRSSKSRNDHGVDDAHEGTTMSPQLAGSTGGVTIIDKHQQTLQQPRQVLHGGQNQQRAHHGAQISSTGVNSMLLARMNLLQEQEQRIANNISLRTNTSSIIESLMRQESSRPFPKGESIAAHQRQCQSLMPGMSGSFTTMGHAGGQAKIPSLPLSLYGINSNVVSPSNVPAMRYDTPIINARSAGRHPLTTGIDIRTLMQPSRPNLLPTPQVQDEIRNWVRAQLTAELLANIVGPSRR